MSDTSKTQVVFAELLPAIATEATVEGKEAAYVEYHHAIAEILKAGQFDEGSLLELLPDRDRNEHVVEQAMRTTTTVKTFPEEFKRIPYRTVDARLLDGSGGVVIAVDGLGQIEAFGAKPNIVEDKYGPGWPYAARKLGQALFSATANIGRADRQPAFGQIEAMLRQNGLHVLAESPHIGATHETVDAAASGIVVASVSSVLPSRKVRDHFKLDTEYFAQSVVDREAGLWEWEHDKYAGLVDVLAARGLIAVLRNGSAQVVKIPSLREYNGVNVH